MAGPFGKSDKKQKQALLAAESVPEEGWYWLALLSIGLSAALKFSGKDNWALFVGQWPPTFLLFGLYNRVVKPGR